MDVSEFILNYFNVLLENVTKENKSVFLLGDFNINLMNYNDHKPTNDFLDSLASSSFIPYILQPTRITDHSKTLIDNIFSNIISQDFISGNLTATISDHLPQFLIAPNVFSNPSSNKSNIYERDWSSFNQDNFTSDYNSVNWTDLLKLEQENVNFSLESYLNKINSILDTHAPFKKVNKYKLKLKTKPWITPGIQKSISVKNKLLKKYINLKDPMRKTEIHNQYKSY